MSINVIDLATWLVVKASQVDIMSLNYDDYVFDADTTMETAAGMMGFADVPKCG